MAQFHLFLWLSSISVYVYTTSSLPIHLSMDTGCFHILDIVNNAAVNIGWFGHSCCGHPGGWGYLPGGWLWGPAMTAVGNLVSGAGLRLTNCVAWLRVRQTPWWRGGPLAWLSMSPAWDCCSALGLALGLANWKVWPQLGQVCWCVVLVPSVTGCEVSCDYCRQAGIWSWSPEAGTTLEGCLCQPVSPLGTAGQELL